MLKYIAKNSFTFEGVARSQIGNLNGKVFAEHLYKTK